MSNSEHYQAKLPVLEAIPKAEIQEPRIPVDTYNQEAEDLYHQAKKDQEILVAGGLDQSMIEELNIRVGASREANTIWKLEKDERSEAQKQWNEQSEVAIKLRSDLLRTLRFVFYNDVDKLKTIAGIEEGESNADLVQDMNDVGKMGQENMEAITAATNEGPEKFEQAIVMSDELADILARANGDRYDENSKKIMRDRAYTHLKELVDQVRRYGKFVFWDNEKQRRKYASKYLRDNY